MYCQPEKLKDANCQTQLRMRQEKDTKWRRVEEGKEKIEEEECVDVKAVKKRGYNCAAGEFLVFKPNLKSLFAHSSSQ